MPCSHCGKPKVLARGLCRTCYHRLWRHGRLERINVVRQPRCSVKGCTRETSARNLCSWHYSKADHPNKNTWKLLRSRTKGKYPAKWESFEGFLEDIGERPPGKCSLRRINPKKAWAADNVRWLERSKFSSHDAKYARDWRLRSEYGLTADDYQAMVAQQGERCAICGTKPKNTLSVDHSHAHGHVRGLLCTGCNRGLGYFSDDPAIIERAITYLRKHEKNEAA